VIKVVIEVKLTSLVYVALAQKSTWTVSWITKQQFVGGGVVDDLVDDRVEEFRKTVGASWVSCIRRYSNFWVKYILGIVEVAWMQVTRVAKRTRKLFENIVKMVCKDSGLNQNERVMMFAT
jgi:hypothetical protein